MMRRGDKSRGVRTEDRDVCAVFGDFYLLLSELYDSERRDETESIITMKKKKLKPSENNVGKQKMNAILCTRKTRTFLCLPARFSAVFAEVLHESL